MEPMSMIEEHRRTYDEDKDIPVWLKWTFTAINRIGFPIVAFILMWYMCEISIARVVGTVEQNTVVLLKVSDTLNRMEFNGRH
jgi:hypothetical protein